MRPRHLAGQRQELGQLTAVQDKDHQLIALGAGGAHTADDDLAQLDAGHLERHGLEIVRIVILPVDEQDLLVAAGDVELALMHGAQIAGAQPAIRGVQRGVRLGRRRDNRP